MDKQEVLAETDVLLQLQVVQLQEPAEELRAVGMQLLLVEAVAEVTVEHRVKVETVEVMVLAEEAEVAEPLKIRDTMAELELLF
jgi:hypothetical protein